jgi:hypothetical protein
MGGSSKKSVVGYWYKLLYHAGLCKGPFDAFLEFRGGDKTAWKGELTASGTLSINQPKLWGGEKDQGGIVSDVDVMFGEPTQAPNAYLLANLGSQVPAWRGLGTLVFKGGKYGAMNPYPQKASYKVRKIKAGWDGDCWYPEKAEIRQSIDEMVVLQELVHDTALDAADDNTAAGLVRVIFSANPGDTIRIRKLLGQTFDAWNAWGEWNGSSYDIPDSDPRWQNYMRIEIDGVAALYWNYESTKANALANAVANPVLLSGGSHYEIYIWDAPPFYNYNDVGGLSVRVERVAAQGVYCNPAHALYFARTNSDLGREPTANINDASLTAAADTLYAEGFGICTTRDPASESVEEFEARICKLIDGSFTRDPIDGQWHLDLARGTYVLADLPILTDDDILEFKELPSTLDNAVNSVSVKYFDPEKKETITTPPVQARGLIAAFGTIHKTIEYLEIPTAALAARVAQRELLATATPTRALELVCTRKPYGWRPNTYFRLQVPKRGIADMVCIVGEKQSGSLKSGAIRLKATQDIYALPTVAFASVEPGVDTGADQVPAPITAQAAFEAPYIDVVTGLPRAELAALPADVGYLVTTAADPARSVDYTVMMDAGGGYAETAHGDWCPTATITTASGFADTAFTLAGGSRLDEVAIGSAALWGSEIVRVDALDITTGAITLGRGCADTVPVQHAAGDRIWFYGGNEALDETEYTDGETLAVKLLTNTGSQQLDIADATALSVPFASRQARPYPPAKLRINGAVAPSTVIGAITVTGVHRDRIGQADQLVDTEAAAIGPEAGTTYTARYKLNGTLVNTDSGLSTPSSTYTPSGAGVMRVEFEAVRGGLASYQMHVREFVVGLVLQAETGDQITTEALDPIIMG